MKQLSEHFWDWEFRCRCGCGTLNVHEDLLSFLELFRTWCGGRSVHIASGCRCEEYNRIVKGHKNSYHLAGDETIWCKAADVVVPGLHILYVASVGISVGCEIKGRGVGLYPARGFVHLDLGPVKQWIDMRTLKERTG